MTRGEKIMKGAKDKVKISKENTSLESETVQSEQNAQDCDKKRKTKPKKEKGAKKAKKPEVKPETQEPDEITHVLQERAELVKMLKKLKFKTRLFFGADVADVWRKIDKLNKQYEAIIKAERIRYDFMMEDKCKNCPLNKSAETNANAEADEVTANEQ